MLCVPLEDTTEPRRHVEQALLTLWSVLEHADAPRSIAVAGPSELLALLAELGGDRLPQDALGIEIPASQGAATALWRLICASPPADVALLVPGVRAHPHWLERLRSAALSDSVIASSSALFDADRAGAAAIATASLRLRPRIERIGPHCALIRRQALELIAAPANLGSLEEALHDLSERLSALGLIHVAADDMAVELPRDAAAGLERLPTALGELGRADEGALEEDRGPLPRAIRRARSSLRPLTVTIDARSLTAAVGGTQTYVLELLLALARDSRVKLRALVPPDLSAQAAGTLRGTEIELVAPEEAMALNSRSDVVHRPQQISSAEDFPILRAAGERLVVTHHDLIAYHNASYHPDTASWLRHREITRAALAVCDRVVFPSQHALRDALSEDLLPEERGHVVATGSAERLMPSPQMLAPPAQLAAGDPFLLCLGADYAHKNRPFAMRMLIELQAIGWQGILVLAGSHVPCGSSREQEEELLDAHPHIRDHVIELGRVDESAKSWLFSRARALIYPSIYEGFGLLPIEAARSRVPCLYAPQASLAEFDAGAATIVPWDAAASAAAAMPLLMEGPARERHLESLAMLEAPSWSDIVEQLVEVYQLAATSRRSDAALLEPDGYLQLLRKATRELDYHRDLAQDYQDALHALEERVSLGLPLIDRGGLLNPAQQRGLMRVASRRPIGALVLSPFGLLGHVRANQQEHGASADADRV